MTPSAELAPVRTSHHAGKVRAHCPSPLERPRCDGENRELSGCDFSWGLLYCLRSRNDNRCLLLSSPSSADNVHWWIFFTFRPPLLRQTACERVFHARLSQIPHTAKQDRSRLGLREGWRWLPSCRSVDCAVSIVGSLPQGSWLASPLWTIVHHGSSCAENPQRATRVA